MADDVVRNKTASIERCVRRIEEMYGASPERLEDQVVEDAIVLNLLRACESSIGLAMHVVATKRLGLPQGSRDAFTLLEREGILDAALADRMKRMVGFRNVAVHEYTLVSRAVLLSILGERLGDFASFCSAVVESS